MDSTEQNGCPLIIEVSKAGQSNENNCFEVYQKCLSMLYFSLLRFVNKRMSDSAYVITNVLYWNALERKVNKTDETEFQWCLRVRNNKQAEDVNLNV